VTDIQKKTGIRIVPWAISEMLRGLGPKPGKEESLAMLISASDIQFVSISQISQRCQRIPKSLRKRGGKSIPKSWSGVAAMRSFIVVDRAECDLVLQLTPCPTIEIARESVAATLERIVVAPTRSQKVANAHYVHDVNIPSVESIFSYELNMVTPSRTGRVMYLSGSVDNILFTMQFGSWRDSWSWNDAVSIGAIQAEKIRRLNKTPMTQD
jgi:hypothetical protein